MNGKKATEFRLANNFCPIIMSPSHDFKTGSTQWSKHKTKQLCTSKAEFKTCLQSMLIK
jgi:hypothetical protein